MDKQQPPKDPIEHVDPISGEVTEHNPAVRFRIRDVYLDDLGREIPDPRPMQPPIGYKRQPSMFEIIREATAREIALYAANREPESFEEADDFDIPDDPLDPQSQWENEFDPPWSEVRQAVLDAREEAARKAAESPPDPKPTVPKPGEPGPVGPKADDIA